MRYSHAPASCPSKLRLVGEKNLLSLYFLDVYLAEPKETLLPPPQTYCLTCSEICIGKWFCCANIKCAYTNRNRTVYHKPSLYGWATDIHAVSHRQKHHYTAHDCIDIYSLLQVSSKKCGLCTAYQSHREPRCFLYQAQSRCGAWGNDSCITSEWCRIDFGSQSQRNSAFRREIRWTDNLPCLVFQICKGNGLKWRHTRWPHASQYSAP